jgi:hypothetical protein
MLWSGSGDEDHPPLYYLLLGYWLPTGRSEYMLRLSSALLGSAAILLTYALCKTLYWTCLLEGRSSGPAEFARSATWLVALSPLLVWYSQELRSYALLVALGLTAAFALARLVTQPTLAWWLLFVGAMAAALYTHYVAVVLVPVQCLLIAVLGLQGRATRQGVRYWLAAWPLVLLLYLPWLTSPTAVRFFDPARVTQLYPVALLAGRLGVSATLATGVIAAAFFGFAVVALLLAGYIHKRGAATWSALPNSRLVRYGLLLLFLVSIVASVIPRAYSVKKLLVVLWPYVLLLVAWVFPWRPQNRAGPTSWAPGSALALLLLASLAGSLVNVILVPKDQWRETVAYILAHKGPADVVWIQPGYNGAPFNYYSRQALELQYVAPEMTETELQALLGQHNRVWLVYQTRNLESVDPEHKVEQWLSRHLEVSDSLHNYQVRAILYTRPP